MVHLIKTPCRFVNEKLEERKRKKEQQRLASYPRPAPSSQPFYSEPYPDYDDDDRRRPYEDGWDHRRRENGGRYTTGRV